MRTANNNYTVEGLVAKYRNFVKENTPKEYVPSEWQDENGKWHIDDFYALMEPDAEEQLLVSLYKEVLGDQANAKVLQPLSKRLEAFKREAFTEDEYLFLCENFSAVSEYLFDHWDEWLGGHSYLSTTPSKIKERIRKMSLNKEGQTVFIADASYCDVAAIFTGCCVNGFTGYCGTSIMYDHAWALGQIRLIAAGIHSAIVPGALDESDNYSYPLPSKGSIDIVIYGTMWSTECKDIEALYNLLKDGGRMLMFFSRFELSSLKENDRAFFQKLVDEEAISSIVSFEEEEPVFGGIDSEILVYVEKKKHSTVHVESAIHSISVNVDAKFLDADMLWPGYYLTNRPKQGCPLSSLVRLFSSKEELRKQYKLRKKRCDSIFDDPHYGLDSTSLVLTPKDFAESYSESDLSTKKLLPLSDATFEDLRGRMLELKDSGVCVHGNSERLLVGYIKHNPANYVCIASIPYLIPKKGIDVRYIAALLLLPEVKQQIITICDGIVSTSTLNMILDRVIVPKHSPKERMQFLAEANYNAMISSQQELKKNHEDYKKAVRMRKHALTQSLSSIEAMFYALDAYRLRKNGNLSDADIISRRKGTTVKEAFEFIEPNLKNMMVTLEHIADVEYSFDSPQMIDPERFIEAYVAQKESGWLNFKPIINWKKGSNQFGIDVRDPETGNMIAYEDDPISVLYFSKDAFKRVLDNVVANAIAHGFTDSNRNDYKLRFSWHTDGMNLVVVVENNGTAIPADRDTASLLEYGVSGALHQDGHNGIGCNEIDDIMRRYDGSVEIVSTPNEEYTVKYVLRFKSNSNSISFKDLGI